MVDMLALRAFITIFSAMLIGLTILILIIGLIKPEAYEDLGPGKAKNRISMIKRSCLTILTLFFIMLIAANDSPLYRGWGHQNKIENKSSNLKEVQPIKRNLTPKNVKTTEHGPNGETIKGNISKRGEKIYHVPGGQFYEVTIPEKWFFTPQDAEKAGYRRSKR